MAGAGAVLAGKRLCVPDDALLHVEGNEDMEGFVRENEAAIASMGGEVVPWPVPPEVSSVDFVVLASSGYEQYAHIKGEAERLGAQMVSDFWVEEAQTTNRLDVARVLDRPLPSGGVPGLANQAAVCLTAVHGRARELAQSMLVVAGMEQVKVRDERLTHLVAGEARGDKFNIANTREPRPHIVTPEWLEACLREWRRVPEHRFPVPQPTSPTGTESALTHPGGRRSSVVTGEEAKPPAADEPRLAATPAAAEEDVVDPRPPAISTAAAAAAEEEEGDWVELPPPAATELAVVEEEPAVAMVEEPLPPVAAAAGEEKEDDALPAPPSASPARQPTPVELQHDNDRNLPETTATQTQPPAAAIAALGELKNENGGRAKRRVAETSAGVSNKRACPATAQSRGVVVAVSCAHTKEKERAEAAALAAGFAVLSGKQWPSPPSSPPTHLVLPRVQRVEKVVCALAAGVWLVKPTWLTAAKRAKSAEGPPPPEKPHAWCTAAAGTQIAPDAFKHWRGSAGAFAGLRAAVTGGAGWSLPSKATIEAVLRAGGAQLVAPHSADVVVSADGTARAGGTDAPHVSPEFILAWVCRPSDPLASLAPVSPAPSASAWSSLAAVAARHRAPLFSP